MRQEKSYRLKRDFSNLVHNEYTQSVGEKQMLMITMMALDR